MISALEAQMLANTANNQKAKVQEILEKLDTEIRRHAVEGFKKLEYRRICDSTVANGVCTELISLGYNASWSLEHFFADILAQVEGEQHTVTFGITWN